MARYKLFRLAGLLENDELNSFAKFLESPYFNTDHNCIKLFRELRKFHPEMEHPRLTKENLFKRTFGKEAYNDQKIRRLMMDLGRLMERYFQVSQLDRTEKCQQRMLIDSLEWRGDYQLFKETTEARIGALKKNTPSGKVDFLELAELYAALHFHPGTNKFTIEHDYLKQLIHFDECYTILCSLQNHLENLISNRTVSTSWETHFIEATKKWMTHEEFTRYPVIRLFQQIFLLYTNSAFEMPLQALSEFLNSIFNQLHEFEQQLALKLLSNYGIPFANAGSLEHCKFIFNLYKLGVENGLLMSGKNDINADHFVNVCTIATRAGEFSWAKNFIKNFQPLLPERERHNASCLVQAGLHYQKGIQDNKPENFREALYYLNLIPSRSNGKYDLRVRSLYARILFESMINGETTSDEVLAQVAYFERHLKNSPVYSDSKKENYLNFLYHFKILTRIASNPDTDETEIDQFLKELHSSGNPFLQHWLNEKAEELNIHSSNSR